MNCVYFTRVIATHKFFNRLTGNFIHFNMAYRQYMAYRQHKQSCTWIGSRTWKISSSCPLASLKKCSSVRSYGFASVICTDVRTYIYLWTPVACKKDNNTTSLYYRVTLIPYPEGSYLENHFNLICRVVLWNHLKVKKSIF